MAGLWGVCLLSHYVSYVSRIFIGVSNQPWINMLNPSSAFTWYNYKYVSVSECCVNGGGERVYNTGREEMCKNYYSCLKCEPLYHDNELILTYHEFTLSIQKMHIHVNMLLHIVLLDIYVMLLVLLSVNFNIKYACICKRIEIIGITCTIISVINYRYAKHTIFLYITKLQLDLISDTNNLHVCKRLCVLYCICVVVGGLNHSDTWHTP